MVKKSKFQLIVAGLISLFSTYPLIALFELIAKHIFPQPEVKPIGCPGGGQLCLPAFELENSEFENISKIFAYSLGILLAITLGFVYYHLATKEQKDTPKKTPHV